MPFSQEFYNEFQRLPKNKEEYKNWKINQYINHLKDGRNEKIKLKIEKIFHQKLIFKENFLYLKLHLIVIKPNKL